MPFDPAKKFRPGDLPSAAELTSLTRQVDALARPTANGDIGVTQSGYGLQIQDFGQKPILIRITSQGSGAAAKAYGWNQVIANADGTYTDQPAGTEYAPYGTPTASPAYERSGRTSVPTDGTVIVEARPGEGQTAFFTFDRPLSGTHARLTTKDPSGPGWKFFPVRWNGTSYADDGAESVGYDLIPLTVDGSNLANPTAGLRLRIHPSKQAGKWEGVPLGYADRVASTDYPGLVSTGAQSFAGPKTFRDPAFVNAAATLPGADTTTFSASGFFGSAGIKPVIEVVQHATGGATYPAAPYADVKFFDGLNGRATFFGGAGRGSLGTNGSFTANSVEVGGGPVTADGYLAIYATSTIGGVPLPTRLLFPGSTTGLEGGLVFNNGLGSQICAVVPTHDGTNGMRLYHNVTVTGGLTVGGSFSGTIDGGTF